MQPPEPTTFRPSWGRRLAGMEGLRGIAATSVLVGHVQSHLGAGIMLPGFVDLGLQLLLNGLTLFFALSGFLLFRPFAAAIISGERLPSVGRFFRNRALRIYPAYVVVLLVVSLILGAAYTSAVGPETGVEGVGDTVGYLFDPVKLLANLAMLHTLFPGTIKTGLGVSWSLSVELIFYLVLPMLAWGAWRRARRGTARLRVGWALAPAALLLSLGLVGRAVSAATTPFAGTPEEAFYWQWGGNWHAVLARSFLTQADLFAFGMVAAVGIVLVERGLLAGRLLMAARAVSVVGIFLAVLVGRQTVLTSDTWWAMGCGSLIFLVAAPDTKGHHFVLARALEWPPVRFIGLVSYSMYLWHLPVLWTLREWGLTMTSASSSGLVINAGLVFAVTVALSTVTYYCIERPALRMKVRTGGAEDVRSQRKLSARA